MTSTDFLFAFQKIIALSQTGLSYNPPTYDRERYENIRDISFQMLAKISDVTVAQIIQLFPEDHGYVTPKVDIRAVIFRNNEELLMVQEKMDDNKWTVPGGWADVGYTPFQVAEKETWEETGLEVKAKRLLAVFDKSRHDHPHQPWYVYKFFILCEVSGGELLQQTTETSEASWIKFADVSNLSLSRYRVTLSQLEMIFKFAADPNLPAYCD
ncbi:ADP-ribose pyrophosphatase YjhB, NUDIX family [Dyadobacter koreensis]|uniref:ADP-ribose pyrophosphatase YjhB, NUDIX family n=1 Tax=Dyadobacter koreensis TaxID=408657 RepID=A0A1H6QEX2_9BACT|nr:NUDIX hydrolase [Dyadobacter koreensis]SEI42261.1 ADP-ribose pyrophosphatase YjhB, NUDIX family [Dyadobacter koreensis]